MKQIILLLTVLLWVACQRDETLPEATSAAKEVYLQYADRKDLTVALIGDYQGYNAVMLQAQTTEDWLRLCEEFGVKKHVNANELDTTRIGRINKPAGLNIPPQKNSDRVSIPRPPGDA